MAEGMLSLSWNNHSTIFTQTLVCMREKEKYTDVTLSCEGRFYPVHKLVLSTCSDYFMQLFEVTPCKHPVIVLHDVQPREMEALLNYMYLGVVSVAQANLPQLIKVAEALQIKGLAVPDESINNIGKYSHTWSPTDGRNSPFTKRTGQENGIQTPRVVDTARTTQSHFQPSYSLPSSSTPGLTTINPPFNNNNNPHRFSPYAKDHSPYTTNNRSKKKNNHVKSEYGYNHTKNDRRNDRIIVKGPGGFRMEKYASTNEEVRDDDDNSSEMQEMLPVSLVKVEVKEEEDEQIDVDGLGTDTDPGNTTRSSPISCASASPPPLPLSLTTRHAATSRSIATATTEGVAAS